MSVRPVLLLAAAGLLAACGTTAGSPSGTSGGPSVSSAPAGSGAPGSPTSSSSSPPAPSSGTSGSRTPNSPATTTSPGASAATDAVYPLTVTRSGGVAGFNDSLTVEPDGRTTVTGKGTATPGSCTIGPAALAQLASHVRTLAKPPSTRVATPDHIRSDQIVLRLMTPVAPRPIQLPDPPTGDAGQFISSLVVDVTGASPAYRVCEPP